MRTVIVRVFEPASGAGEVGLHGLVDDVSGGTSEVFAGLPQLVEMLDRIVRHPPEERREPPASATDPERTQRS